MNSQTQNKAHGGARAGAGRKAAPTKPVRVPEGTEAIARQLVELVQNRAIEALKETQWYKSVPRELKPEAPTIVFESVQDYEIHVSMGILSEGSYMAPFAVFSTIIGPYKGTFRVRLDIAALGAVMMDEVAVND